MTIRPLRRTDVTELQAIDEVAHGEAWSTAAFADQIDNAAFRHLVAENSAGEIVGHAGVWRDGTALRITNVAVHADAAGQGIATDLLLALLADPRDIDRLELEVRPTNRNAQRLYNRFGFAPVGVERNFYDRSDASGSRDALVMAVAEPHGAAWRDRIAALSEQANDDRTPRNRTGTNKGEAA